MDMTNKDRLDAYNALCDWFKSQDISQGDALPILIVLTAQLLWDISQSNALSILIVLTAQLLWDMSQQKPEEAARLADLAHLKVVRHLGVCLAEQVGAKQKNQ